MIKENYVSKIKHLENMARIWGKRSLSPIGKITVIKIFMISAFNHLFSSLPNPNKRVIDHINNILYTFLWNNKPNKIKSSIITKQVREGGLQMVNLNAFIEAQKATWVRRLLTTNSKWQTLLYLEIDLEKLCSCHIKYAESFLSKTYNKCWKDVLQAFININKNINLKDDMVLQTPLFYNINIKIGGSHIFYKTWFDKGIRFLNDLIHENGEFYSHEEFQENTGINSNTLQYHGTIKPVK